MTLGANSDVSPLGSAMPVAILPLPDLISVMAAAGVVAGGATGLFWPYRDTRTLAENMVLGSGLGLIAGSALALVIGIVDAVAGV